eukprot:scaffold2498_cov227-Pavlova_lutheri.AAC.2
MHNLSQSDALAWASGASMLFYSRLDAEPLDPALGSASPPSAASPAWPSSAPDAPTLSAAWSRVRQMAAVPTDATIGIAETAADTSAAAIGPAACEARQVVSATRALPMAVSASHAHAVRCPQRGARRLRSRQVKFARIACSTLTHPLRLPPARPLARRPRAGPAHANCWARPNLGMRKF